MDGSEVSFSTLSYFIFTSPLINMFYAVFEKVIKQILKDDLARVQSKTWRPCKNGKPYGYFHELTISPSEWASIQELNTELEVSWYMIIHFAILTIEINVFYVHILSLFWL